MPWSEEFSPAGCLTIISPEPETPLTQEDYPPGKLITLTDPSTEPLN